MKLQLSMLTLLASPLKRDGARAKALSGIIACMMITSISIQAAVVVQTPVGSNAAFTVSANDLLETDLASSTDALTLNVGENNAAGGNTSVVLRNGLFGDVATNGKYQGVVIDYGQITYTLNTSLNPLGYTLTSIDTYAGWADANRGTQAYTIEYSTVGSTGFTTLATVPFNKDGFTQQKISIIEDTTGILATGVDAIRFKFGDGSNSIWAPTAGWTHQEFNGVCYKEIDIFGEPIPLIWDGIASGDASWTNPDSNSWTGGTYTNGMHAQFLGAGTGTVTIAGTVSPGRITVSNSLGNDYTLSGTIAGTGAVIKDGTGSLTLSGSTAAYSFSSITVDGGELEVSGQQYNGTVNINNGATYLDNTGSTWVPTFNFGSNGGGTVQVGAGNHLLFSTTVTTTGGAENFISGGSWNAINVTIGGAYTFNVADGTDASDLTVSTLYYNWPRILKTGAGTLTLTASNNNITPSTVNQGTLLFNGSSTPTPATSPFYGQAFSVNNSGTLGGTGTIIDPVSVSAGGTLAAGDVNRIGTLTLTKGLSFASASATNVVRVTGVGAAQQNKVLVTGGAITLGSATLVIDDTGLSDITSQKLTVIDNQTAAAVSGTFNGLAEGAKVSGINGSEWVISYVGGSGNDVVLTPPPSGTIILIQ